MSLWNTLVQKLKGIIGKMIGTKAIEKELQVTYAISPQMETAIQTWSKMYGEKADWLHEPDAENPIRVVSLGLPAMIASEKARTALLEFESEITAPTHEVVVPNQDIENKSVIEEKLSTLSQEPVTTDEPTGNTQRAEYLESQYKKLKKQLRKQIEYGIAKGGLVIKPYIVVNNQDTKNKVISDIIPTTKIEFDFIQADSFYPLAFDASGKITEAAFIQSKVDKAIIYRRLEYHKWENNVVTIINKAYKTNNKPGMELTDTDLGDEISLSDVPEWKNFEKEIVIKNVEQPLFAYFKMPEANIIDTLSPLGVSGFSRAVSLIRDADLQYSRLLWEYEAGEMAVNIDRDAFKYMDDPQGNGHTSLGAMQERLYRRVDISDNELFEPYAPSLRDNNYISGLNTILMRIEDVCAISRGTLSDSVDIARTATELKILKQRSYQANVEIQQAIETVLRDVIYVMNVYCTLYNITPEGPYDVSFEWDDSLIVDTYEELNARLALMGEGLVSKLENRMWYFGETKRQAQDALDEIDKETTKSMERDLVVQSTQLDDEDDDVARQNKQSQQRSNQQKLNQRGMSNPNKIDNKE